MKPIEKLDGSDVQLVFCDIDDTLTQDGRLEPEAYQAIWDLYRAGIHVVPITGRPAGWCELIARQWPVFAVIGENGGFYFSYQDLTMKRIFIQDQETRSKNRMRLDQLANEILKAVPGSALASDQFCRQLDLAIDYCEDVPPLSLQHANFIQKKFEEHGATAKISSIHVNGWFGNYDKLKMCKVFLKNEFSWYTDKQQNSIVFVGDSPNDEPMFGEFNLSVGVANVKAFESLLKTPPQFITHQSFGKGFAEVSKQILKSKN